MYKTFNIIIAVAFLAPVVIAVVITAANAVTGG